MVILVSLREKKERYKAEEVIANKFNNQVVFRAHIVSFEIDFKIILNFKGVPIKRSSLNMSDLTPIHPELLILCNFKNNLNNLN